MDSYVLLSKKKQTTNVHNFFSFKIFIRINNRLITNSNYEVSSAVSKKNHIVFLVEILIVAA